MSPSKTSSRSWRTERRSTGISPSSRRAIRTKSRSCSSCACSNGWPTRIGSSRYRRRPRSSTPTKRRAKLLYSAGDAIGWSADRRGQYGSVSGARPSRSRHRDQLLHPSLADAPGGPRAEGHQLARVPSQRHHRHDVGEHQGSSTLLKVNDGHTLTDRAIRWSNADEALPIMTPSAAWPPFDAGLLPRHQATNVMRERRRIVLMDFGAGLDVTDGAAVHRPSARRPMAPEVLDGQPASQS